MSLPKSVLVTSFEDYLDRTLRGDQLVVFTAYKGTKDFGDRYVLRPHCVKRGGVIEPSEFCAVAETLEELRRFLPFGYTNIGREVQDDPCIVETWI
ncbi:MAG: hypothetical protein ACRCXH_01980 [Shewanella sp.]